MFYVFVLISLHLAFAISKRQRQGRSTALRIQRHATPTNTSIHPSVSNNPYFNSIMINPFDEVPDIPDLTSLSLRSAPGPSNSIAVSHQLPFIPVDEWLNETTIAAAYQRMSLLRVCELLRY